MELRHLRYFVAVAEELHFSRAAERLHVSQPPLSQQIKQLEEEVQVRLFDRTKRWVRLTSAGRLFLEHARQVLTQVDGAVFAARQTTRGECHRLSVACTPWAGYLAIPHILRRFTEQHPNVRIEIQTLTALQQLRALKAGGIDVGFMWRNSADEDLQVDALLAHPLVVALPVRHRLAARAQVSPRELSSESYVTLAPDVAPVYSQAVRDYWEKAGVARKEQHTADRPHSVMELIAAGAGFALIPLPVHECADQRIVCRRLDPAPPQLELTLVRSRGMESSAVNALREVALQITKQKRSLFMGETREAPHAGSPDLTSVRRLSRAGEAEQARTNGPHQLSATSPVLRARRLNGDSGEKSIRRPPTRDVAVASTA
jgi:DNA-binding transcriptional LysR family regulator